VFNKPLLLNFYISDHDNANNYSIYFRCELIMKALFSRLFVVLFVLFIAACDSGSGSPTNGTTSGLADALLVDLSLSNGVVLNEEFDSKNREILATASNSASSVSITPTLGELADVVTVNGVAVESAAASADISLAIGENVITIVITSLNDSISKTYTLTVTRLEPGVAKLSALTVIEGELDKAFDSEVFTYTILVDGVIDRVRVNPVPLDPASTVRVNSSIIAYGGTAEVMPLNDILNTIVIEVISEDGTASNTYNLVIVKHTASSDDSVDLVSLSISAGELFPAFESDVQHYNAGVESSVESILVTSVADSSTTTITVNDIEVISATASSAINLLEGNNVIVVNVASSDASTEKSYVINVTRQAVSDSSLSYIGLGAGSLTPDFSSDVLQYNVNLLSAVSGINIIPVATDVEAAVSVNGDTISSGSASYVTLNPGSNSVSVVVTSSDSSMQSAYQITIANPDSVSVKLADLEISSGSLIPVFGADTLSYSVSVVNSVTDITLMPTANSSNFPLTVNGVLHTSGTASAPIPLSVGDNVIPVAVTSADGMESRTYNVTVNRAPNENASLSGLAVSDGSLSPSFNAAIIAYDVNVANSVSSITFSPSSVAGATITVDGAVVSSGATSSPVSLLVGDNIVEIDVVSEDGLVTTKYTMTVNRAGSADANLSALVISEGSLSPAFSSENNIYTASVTSDITSVTLVPTASHSSATIKVDNVSVSSGVASASVALSVGSNTIDVDVLAEDGITTATYTVTVTRAPSNNANLSAVSLTPSASFTPSFSGDTLTYTTTVSNATSSVTVTPTVDYMGANVEVNSIAVNSGEASGSIALSVGDNVITIVVTAEDGITQKTYQITVRRRSDVADLTMLSISVGALSPSFDVNTLAYNSTVPNAQASMTVTPTVAHASASVTVNSVSVNSGEASGAIALSVGDNIITVEVTSEDSTTKTYVVTMKRYSVAEENPDLGNLVSSFGSFDQVFQDAQTSYTMTVGYLVNSIRLTPTVEETGLSTVEVDSVAVSDGAASDVISLSEGANTPIDVVVTAADGVNTKTYQLTVTRETSAVFAAQTAEYIKANNTDTNDYFGLAVDLSGDTLVVGAPFEDSEAIGINDLANKDDDCGAGDTNCSADSGAVYVFVRNAGVWSEQAYIKSDFGTFGDFRAGDEFGHSVAIDGDTLVVGAWKEDSDEIGVGGTLRNNWAGGSGAVFVYKRTGSTWVHEAFVKAPNTNSADRFGVAVDIDADTLVVGAFWENSGDPGNYSDNSASHAGAVYTYTRSGAAWTYRQYIKAANPGAGDLFGVSVAIHGDVLVVGAPDEDGSATGVGGVVDDTAANAGAAYIYERTGTIWDAGTYVKSANIDAGDRFGHSVAVYGDHIAVGTYVEASSTEGVNNAYDNSSWGSGAAYVFRNNSGWSQTAFIKASTNGGNDFFGRNVRLGDGILVVSAPAEDSNATTIDGSEADNSNASSGAVYVFHGSGAAWTQVKYLKAPNNTAGDFFGGGTAASVSCCYDMSIAVDGDSVAVGAALEAGDGTGVNPADNDNTAGSGAVYIYK